MMEDWERAWLACAFDGEGTISLSKYKMPNNRSGYQYGSVMKIANTSRDFLEFARVICGCGKINPVSRKGRGNRRDCYILQFSPNQARELLPEILGFLIIKERQAVLVLEALGLLVKGCNQYADKSYLLRLEEIYWELKDLNGG